ncbi:Helix-turn-helix domain-containing protein [Micromonospora mirobrigensis]|uniref:Helix-turn-helix domain-containing protein n=1 Tax=Micromonospora mirobrigensis TaxID=262898 RepID=A0A1C4V0S4_9ACTN|nr:Helix-turn-helix domain-containing protein [Micromonospora mirobrigensis]
MVSEPLEQPEFGQRLRALRRERGMSQADVVGPGMSAAYLSRLESGARPPTARAVQYLAEKLELPPSAFSAEQPEDLSTVLATITSSEDGDTVEPIMSAVRTDGQAGAATRWQALWILARLQIKQGRHGEALKTLDALAELSTEVASPELEIRARNQLARCQRSLGDVTAARASALLAHALVTAHEVPASDVARTLMTLVSIEAEAGHSAEAHVHITMLDAIIPDLPVVLRVEALWTTATVLTREGDHKGSAELLERALDELDSRDDLTLWLRLRLAAASLYLQMRQPATEEAQRRLTQAESALDLVGTPRLAEEFAFLHALLAFHQGDLDLAGERSDELAGRTRYLSFRDRIRLDLLRNQVRLIRDDRVAAIAELRGLALQAQDAGYSDLAADIWRTLADLL